MNSKTVVITGASSGIGMELAREFAMRGYRLVVVARRADKLWRLAEDMNRMYGINTEVIQRDLAQPGAGEALWKEIAAITTDVDVLVNNAGVGDSGDFSAEQPELIERMLNLNIATLTLLTRLVLPGMLARKRGKILNVASLAGFQPGGPGMAVYYASKSYVLSFSQAIRRELSGSGVSVTTLCPGATRTEFEETAGAQRTLLFRWAKPMAARDVARAGFDALQQGRAIVVPGLLNKVLALSAKLAPSSIALEVNRFLLSERR